MEKRVIIIDEDSFNAKAIKVIDQMTEDGGPRIGLTSTLFAAKLRKELFSEEESKERVEHNDP
jgi:rRNA maturation protein Rpf1